MEITRYEDLGEMQLDAMRELASIGSGNAATALSDLLRKEVRISVPRVNLLDFNSAASILGGPETIVSGVLVKMSGDINGIALYVQDLAFINSILDSVMGKTISDYMELDEITSSAVVEISNIIISSYTNALTQMTNLNIGLSVPAHAINMAAALLTVPMAEINVVGSKVLFLDGDFTCSGQASSSKLLLMPDVNSLSFILKKLGL